MYYPYKLNFILRFISIWAISFLLLSTNAKFFLKILEPNVWTGFRGVPPPPPAVCGDCGVKEMFQPEAPSSVDAMGKLCTLYS
jgi:hypothetical protein